jgi:hypothetical protein
MRLLKLYQKIHNKLLKRTKNSWLLLVPRYFSQLFYCRLAKRYTNGALMRIWFSFMLLIMSNQVFGAVKNVHIVRSDIGETLATFIIPITPKEYNNKTVWRSPKGIECSISLFTQGNGGAAGGYECITPEKYKAQVALDCAVNKSRETAVYLFFGKVGHDSSEIGNFYIWCE